MAEKTFPAFPVHTQPAIFLLWQEAILDAPCCCEKRRKDRQGDVVISCMQLMRRITSHFCAIENKILEYFFQWVIVSTWVHYYVHVVVNDDYKTKASSYLLHTGIKLQLIIFYPWTNLIHGMNIDVYLIEHWCCLPHILRSDVDAVSRLLFQFFQDETNLLIPKRYRGCLAVFIF